MARELIRRASAAAAPREACGILAGADAYELPNRATGRDTFHIWAEDLAAVAEQVGGWGAVSGLWHSHPEGHRRPSDPDLDHHPLGKDLVIATLDGELHCYGVSEA